MTYGLLCFKNRQCDQSQMFVICWIKHDHFIHLFSNSLILCYKRHLNTCGMLKLHTAIIQGGCELCSALAQHENKTLVERNSRPAPHRRKTSCCRDALRRPRYLSTAGQWWQETSGHLVAADKAAGLDCPMRTKMKEKKEEEGLISCEHQEMGSSPLFN